MAEERIKKIDKDRAKTAESHGADSGKGQRELTPEQLAIVAGGNTEQVAKGMEERHKGTQT